MTRPRTFCLEHDLSTEPVTVEVAKAAVKAYLHGVVGLSGLLCNGELDPEGDLLRTVCPFGDSMHNSCGHAKDHVKGTFAELKAVEERERLKEHLKLLRLPWLCSRQLYTLEESSWLQDVPLMAFELTFCESCMKPRCSSTINGHRSRQP